MRNTGRRVPKHDLVFYHWSPVERRAAIRKQGFRVGSPSLQGDWNPPYTCFSDDPLLAWYLSGRIHDDIERWDLWMVFSGDVEGWECIMDTYVDTGQHYVKEYRVYHNIKKLHIRYIASRSQRGSFR